VSDRTWKIAGAIALCALVGFVVYVVVAQHPAAPKTTATFPDPAPTALAVGTAAPAFDLPSIEGGAHVSIASYRGKPVILNFFASWCQNCQVELSAFATAAQRVAGKVAVVGVDTDDQSEATALQLLRRDRASYPVGVDSKTVVATRYRLEALPATYFVFANGTIAGVAFGPQSVTDLLRWADTLLRGGGP
jgi:cytochrome c biogenesis protein CcmG/thiol:disulfide interchange protein DsbE